MAIYLCEPTTMHVLAKATATTTKPSRKRKAKEEVWPHTGAAQGEHAGFLARCPAVARRKTTFGNVFYSILYCGVDYANDILIYFSFQGGNIQ